MKSTLSQKLCNKFSKIFLLTLSSRPDRQSKALKSLENIGLNTNNGLTIQYATPFPHNDIIAAAFNQTGKGRFTKANEYDCARNHYSIVRQAYDDPTCKFVLIFEDDIQFLNNLDIISQFIDSIPEDFDVLQFGGFTADPKITKYLKDIDNIDNSYWTKHNDVGIWNCSMYALSRKGMKYYLDFMNTIFWVADGPLYKAPLNHKIINSYISTIPIVIQADKNIVSSDIRNSENDNIDYENENLYEKKVDKMNYFEY